MTATLNLIQINGNSIKRPHIGGPHLLHDKQLKTPDSAKSPLKNNDRSSL
jgi:hypothetical protein